MTMWVGDFKRYRTRHYATQIGTVNGYLGNLFEVYRLDLD
jgi:hypothetical protein